MLLLRVVFYVFIGQKNFLSSLCKGQLISKCLFGVFNSPKKQTNKFDFTTVVPQIELFLFVLWENWSNQKDISKLTDLCYLLNSKILSMNLIQIFKSSNESELNKSWEFYSIFIPAGPPDQVLNDRTGGPLVHYGMWLCVFTSLIC